MKKLKQILKKGTVAFLALALVAGTVGCSSEKETASDDVTRLKMVLVGDKPVIYDEIYSKLNEMLRQDIGAEVEVEFISTSDSKTKYPLMFSANEKFDIVYSADWLSYNKQASMNSFMEITDEMLKTNAPKTYESVSQSTLDEAKVGGKLFMVPNTAEEFDVGVAVIRGDLRKKYNIDKLETVEDFENYLYTVVSNDPTFIGYGSTYGISTFWLYTPNKMYQTAPGGSSGNQTIMYRYPDDKIVEHIFTDEFENYAAKMSELTSKKIIPDLVSNKTVSTAFENGKAAAYVHNLDTAAAKAKELNAKHPEWELELFDATVGVPKIANKCTQNGLSLNRTTPNADKALQFIDLLRNDKRYFDLTWYGIEGKHWKSEGENGYTSLNSTLPESEQYVPGCVWGWKNQPMLRNDTTDLPERKIILDRWATESIDSKIKAFVFDDSNVKTESAAVSSVASQYGGPLTSGMVPADEIKASVATYREKLKQAGYDKLYSEFVNQYNEYLKNIE